MKTRIKTILATGLLLPGLVFAMDPFDRYVEENDIEISNSGSIYSETSASASSGGQHAAAGQSVTDGDVSASSHVETYINANDEGGTVQVKVETSKNGETETKEYTEEIAPREPVNVNVSAKVDSGGSKVEANINGEEAEAASSTDVEVEAETKLKKAFDIIPNFFKKVFSFFWGW